MYRNGGWRRVVVGNGVGVDAMGERTPCRQRMASGYKLRLYGGTSSWPITMVRSSKRNILRCCATFSGPTEVESNDKSGKRRNADLYIFVQNETLSFHTTRSPIGMMCHTFPNVR